MRSTPPPPPELAPQQEQQSVLVLARDATTREWLVNLLGQANYKAEGVSELEALEARCQVSTYSAIVLDPLNPAVRSGHVLLAVRSTPRIDRPRSPRRRLRGRGAPQLRLRT